MLISCSSSKSLLTYSFPPEILKKLPEYSRPDESTITLYERAQLVASVVLEYVDSEKTSVQLLIGEAGTEY